MASRILYNRDNTVRHVRTDRSKIANEPPRQQPIKRPPPSLQQVTLPPRAPAQVISPPQTAPVRLRRPVIQHAHKTLPPAPVEVANPMRMLHVVLWKWTQPGFRESYTARHVNICSRMLRDALGGVPHRILLLTDERYGVDDTVECYNLWSDHDTIANASGWHLPSCYRRLKLFDPATLETLGVRPGDRVCSIDLDVVVTGSLKNIVYRRERFVGWGVPGTYHARVFNGSFWMFTAGDLAHLWTEFDPVESPKLALRSGFLGSDQGWLSMNLARAGDAHGVRWPDIASFPREVRRMRMAHRDTSLVFFHGGKKPWHPDVQREQTWIKRFWHD